MLDIINKIMNIPDIIKNALEYYDSNKIKYEKFFSLVNNYKIQYNKNDLDDNYIIFFDNNNNEILKSKYQIISKFDEITNIWIWAWSDITILKKDKYISKQLFDYGFRLEDSENLLKLELTTSRYPIDNNIQIDIYCALISYISKIPCLYIAKQNLNIKLYQDDISIKSDLIKYNKNDKNDLFLYKYLLLKNFEEIDKYLDNNSIK